MTILLRISASLLLASTLIAGAQAQEPSRERELLRRAQSALQRSEQDKAKLQEDKARLEGEKAGLDAKLKAAQRTRRELAVARKKEADQQKALDESHQQTEAAKAKIAELQGQLEKMAGALHQSEEQGRQLAAQVKDLDQKLAQQREIIARQTQIVQACDEKNAKLVEVTNELLAKYKQKGVWDAIAQQEPFTGIKEVQIQNLLQDYRDKVEGLRVSQPELRQ